MFEGEMGGRLKIFPTYPILLRVTGWYSNKKALLAEGLLSSVSAEGVEPSTNGLKGRCSAIELRAHRYG
jgi:hypothetical protein